MELPAAHDAGLTTRAQRAARASEVETLVREAVAICRWDDLAAKLDAIGFGYTEVKPPERVLEDQQARAPGKLDRFSFDGIPFDVPAFPLDSGAPPSGDVEPPPQLGEHTLTIIRSLGFSDAECDALRSAGAIHAASEAVDSCRE